MFKIVYSFWNLQMFEEHFEYLFFFYYLGILPEVKFGFNYIY